MGVLLTRRLLAAATILTMIACGFVFSSSGSCLTSISEAGAGLACSAESIGAQTMWLASNAHVAVQTKKLLITTLAVLATIFLSTPRPIKRKVVSSVWRAKRSPIPNHTFIPQLSASHGG